MLLFLFTHILHFNHKNVFHTHFLKIKCDTLFLKKSLTLKTSFHVEYVTDKTYRTMWIIKTTFNQIINMNAYK